MINFIKFLIYLNMEIDIFINSIILLKISFAMYQIKNIISIWYIVQYPFLLSLPSVACISASSYVFAIIKLIKQFIKYNYFIL